VWDGGAIGGGNAATAWITINTNDVNEAPSLGGGTFSVVENSPPAGQTRVGTIAASDPDTAPANRNFRYELISGDTSMFSVNSTNGDLMLQGSVDYEARSSYSVQARVWDGGAIGSGNSATAWYNVNVTDMNEAAVISNISSAFWIGYGYFVVGDCENYYSATFNVSDPEGVAAVTTDANSYFLTISYTPGSPTATATFIGYQHSSALTVTDTQGNNTYFSISTWGNSYCIDWGGYGNIGITSPIVLDLDGDGVELVSATDANAPRFDMDGDGVRDHTGWVAPDDGMLAIDRDGNGLITEGEEISFSADQNGAVSDLEGLRAYDSNQNGVIDAGDEHFADLRVWQDANQDGVCTAGELTTLTDRGITAINLTLTPTGASLANITDNVLYGTTQFIKSDGSTGVAGDVALAYASSQGTVTIQPVEGEPPPAQPDQQGQNSSNQLGPVVLDLDGNGVTLQERVFSRVKFDMNDNGIRQKTGWVGPNDGLLALDRNGDGKIASGSEISFKNDLPGAVSDLEGLRAYDTNQNGFFDDGDVQFADFRVWRDANQDGVSQSDELNTLAGYGIKAINLTRSLTGQTADGADENVLYATTEVLHIDGTTSAAGDVFLAYDDDPPPPKVLTESERRTLLSQAKRSLQSQWMSFDTPLASNKNSWRGKASLASLKDQGDENGGGNEPGQPVGTPKQDDDPWQTNIAAAHDAGGQSALDAGLGVLNRSVLQMVSAMSTFNSTAPGSVEPLGHKQRAKGMEYLTALPDLQHGNSLRVA
jgi:hypothetical protein